MVGRGRTLHCGALTVRGPLKRTLRVSDALLARKTTLTHGSRVVLQQYHDSVASGSLPTLPMRGFS